VSVPNNDDKMKSADYTFCGLDCNECVVYKATQQGNMLKLRETAAKWSEEENRVYEAEDLLCDGCHSDRLSKYCTICEVRKCGLELALRTCADCGEYPCDKLRAEWGNWTEADPQAAKETLDNLRAGP